MKSKCNNYGYKVCYREKNSKEFVRHFKTYKYTQARLVKQSYILYPPRARKDNRKLIKPIWRIIPITHKEVIDGIWRECPF